MEAPEKIYVHVKGNKVTNTWNSTWIGVHDIEYTRTDAFTDFEEFIRTLEVEEVDLVEELGNYIEHYRNRETGYTMLGIAKHFFNLGLKAREENKL